jgi:hypothetical protein
MVTLSRHTIEQLNCPQDGVARDGRRDVTQRFVHVTLQDLDGDPIHRRARREQLCHDLLAWLAIGEHADDAANLPFYSAQSQLQVRLGSLNRCHS